MEREYRCEICERHKEQGKPPVRFKKATTVCFVCKKKSNGSLIFITLTRIFAAWLANKNIGSIFSTKRKGGETMNTQRRMLKIRNRAAEYQKHKMEDQLRIEQIRERVAEYREHENDPYAYDRCEIDAVRELYLHAAEDIEFLLKELLKELHENLIDL
ncbi:MAG: hypothetical protein WCT26_01025 [Candidatus Buchananbacteria bacterium]